jgi:RNA polymerase sigma-70 factor (ECF subfamily)
MKENIADEFKKIYKEQSDAIFRFCFIRVSNREQALDITQETFLRLWKNMLEEKDILNNRAFLFTVAHRLIIDWYRKKKSISLDGIMDNDEASFDLPDEKTLNNIDLGVEGRYLLSKINDLESTHREAVYLRFVENLTPQEIGNILNISANAAGARVNRGLQELREKTGYNNEK